jgi:hypothetical protein
MTHLRFKSHVQMTNAAPAAHVVTPALQAIVLQPVAQQEGARLGCAAAAGSFCCATPEGCSAEWVARPDGDLEGADPAPGVEMPKRSRPQDLDSPFRAGGRFKMCHQAVYEDRRLRSQLLQAIFDLRPVLCIDLVQATQRLGHSRFGQVSGATVQSRLGVRQGSVKGYDIGLTWIFEKPDGR